MKVTCRNFKSKLNKERVPAHLANLQNLKKRFQASVDGMSNEEDIFCVLQGVIITGTLISTLTKVLLLYPCDVDAAVAAGTH